LRIIGGKNRGRKLFVPEGNKIRPTSDRIRESIFNILNSHMDGGFDGKVVVDLFSGTGALGLEAMSRGARSAILVDSQLEAITLIKRNVENLGEDANITVLKRDATRIGPFPFLNSNADIIFLDPPYDRKLIPVSLGSLIDNDWLANESLCIIELSIRETIDYHDEFNLVDIRKYGKTLVHILRFKS